MQFRKRIIDGAGVPIARYVAYTYSFLELLKVTNYLIMQPDLLVFSFKTKQGPLGYQDFQIYAF